MIEKKNKVIISEIQRIKEIMGIKLINEGIVPAELEQKVLKKVLGATEKQFDNLEKAGIDMSSLLKSSDELTRQGIDSFEKFIQKVAKESGLSSIDNLDESIISAWLKNNDTIYQKFAEEMAQKIAASSDAILKKTEWQTLLPAGTANNVLDILNMKVLGTVDELNDIQLVSDELKKAVDKTILGIEGKGGKVPDSLKKLSDDLGEKFKQAENVKLNQNNLNTTKLNTNTIDPQDYLKGYTQEELEAKLGSYNWKNIGHKQDLMSGWKFHIFGEDIKDAVYLQDALKSVIDKYKSSAKVGGTYQNSADAFKPGQIQHGKQGVTIYIPPDVINSGRQQEMLTDIQNAISGYKKGGVISGDQAITPSIHYRYELMGPIPKNGIDMTTYSKMYSSNEGGSYKPSDVEDIFTNNTTSYNVNTVKPLSSGFLATKFGDTSKINWDLITNAKNISDYDVVINDAIKNNDFNKISRGGFEEYGIPNFREYLMNLFIK